METNIAHFFEIYSRDTVSESDGGSAPLTVAKNELILRIISLVHKAITLRVAHRHFSSVRGRFISTGTRNYCVNLTRTRFTFRQSSSTTKHFRLERQRPMAVAPNEKRLRNATDLVDKVNCALMPCLLLTLAVVAAISVKVTSVQCQVRFHFGSYAECLVWPSS